MRYRKLAVASAALAVVLASPVSAHRQWLLPSTTVLAGTNDGVTIDAAVSNDVFTADHFSLGLDQVSVWAPDGSKQQMQNPASGQYRSTFDVKIDKPGTWKIGVERSSLSGSFTLDGDTWRVGAMRGRPGGGKGSAKAPEGPGIGRVGQGGPGGEDGPRGPGGPGGPNGAQGGFNPAHVVATPDQIPANATDVKLTETIARNFVFVSADTPTTAVFTPTGKGLELQPITHPDELVADEEGQFRFLVDGKPAAGVKVTVVPGGKKFRAAEEAQELTTGGDGVLHVKWPVPGVYWISGTLTDNHPSDAHATERRMTYTMTVEVVAP